MIYMHDRAELKRPSRDYKPILLPEPSINYFDAMETRAYLDKRWLSIQLAQANGWYPSRMDVLRLVIPCVRSDGQKYYQARDITGTSALRYTSPFIPRGDALVVLKRWNEATAYRNLVICEGPMDALAALGTGQCDAAIALMGNHPGETVWSHVLRYVGKYDHVYVVQDSDAAEIVGKIWLPKLARSARSLSLVISSPAKDFAELTQEQRKQKLVR